jgi:hypothetical protein
MVLGAILALESCATILLSDARTFSAYEARVQPGTVRAALIAILTVVAFLLVVVTPARARALGPGVARVASLSFAVFFALFTWWCFAWVEARSIWWVLAWFGGAFAVTFVTARLTLLMMRSSVRSQPTSRAKLDDE